MSSPLQLFRFAAKAALNYVGFGVAGDFAVEVLPSIARDVWQWWGSGRPAAELRGEVQAIAALPDDQARQLAAEAVTAEAAAPGCAATAAQQEQVRAYLSQVPAVVRATQRRLADPSGRTVAPSFPLERAADLLPLLPARLPRFKKGDRPAGLGGDWQLEELLGAGGFGEVWKTVHPTLSPWAVKFCLDPAARRSLVNEAELLGRVAREGTHPGIVRLIHTALASDPPLLAYEFVAGGELTTLIRDWHAKPPADLPNQAARLMQQLAGIVAFAHRLNPPIVHRDLKPANVLLELTTDGQVRLRVADFGIGGIAAAKGTGHTLATVLSGSHTPLYASPQQKNGDRPDPRDDVHALGVIWLHLLTGDLTLEPGHWREELEGRDLPPAMLDLLGACVSRRAEKRPANAGEMEARLDTILQGGAAPSPQPPPQAIPVQAANSVVAKALQSLGGVVPAHAQARELEERHAYADAVRVLENVPQQLRDAALYARLVSRRDEVDQLEQTIHKAIEAGRFVGLRLSVERLLKLTPNRSDMRQLLEALPPLPREIVNSIGMKLVLISPGRFLMGSPPDEADRQENEHQHEVEITRPFYMGVFPVTQADYQRVMGSNPSNFKGSNRPVEQASWQEAVDFCNRLSQSAAEQTSGRTYRLPTEAEWEYACRGGASSSIPFHFGRSLSTTQANFDGDFPYGGASKGPNRRQTTDVGSFDPNAWGLYDMHGNVWEWCQDWFGENYYKQSSRQDPQGPATGLKRVVRGGAWSNSGANLRAASRHRFDPGQRGSGFGFRVVLLFS
jgi:formylglycine-generating enzyme required for sulfatase activity